MHQFRHVAPESQELDAVRDPKLDHQSLQPLGEGVSLALFAHQPQQRAMAPRLEKRYRLQRGLLALVRREVGGHEIDLAMRCNALRLLRLCTIARSEAPDIHRIHRDGDARPRALPVAALRECLGDYGFHEAGADDHDVRCARERPAQLIDRVIQMQMQNRPQFRDRAQRP